MCVWEGGGGSGERQGCDVFVFFLSSLVRGKGNDVKLE